MFYVFPFDIPPNTLIDNELSYLLELHYGIVKRIDILFPPGSAGLTKVRLFRFNTQIIPLNFGEYLYSDSENISIPMDLPIIDRPYELLATGYNLDEIFNHVIQIRILVEKTNPEIKILTPEEESLSIIEEYNLSQLEV